MKINDVSLFVSAVRRSQYPTDGKDEFLLVGRSNVEKVALLTVLLAERILQEHLQYQGKLKP